MATGEINMVMGFGGGFLTDMPDQARGLTYFLKLENCLPEVDTGVRKIGGTEPLFQGTLNGLPTVNGMYDWWLSDGAGTFTQHFVIVTDAGEIYRDNLDGSAANITGALSIGSDPIPVFCPARDLLTIWFSNGASPAKFSGTGTCTALGGSPPPAKGAVFHAGRMFAWLGSRLYYSARSTIEDWTGVDSGSFDISDGDGDDIVGAISFRKTLFIFKGPNKGSIHVITGSAPTGANAFAREDFNKGIPLQTHNSIIQVGNDVLFMSNRGIHSLATTQEFGNFTSADESRFLKKFFRELNHSRLNRVWAADYGQKSAVLWATPGSGLTVNDKALGFSYVRMQEEGYKPFIINRTCSAIAVRRNPSNKLDELIFGTNQGTVLKQDVAARSESAFSTTGFQLDLDRLDIDILGGLYGSRAYNMRVQTPQLLLAQGDKVGQPRGDQPFTLTGMYIRAASSGNHNLQVAVTRDSNPPESYTFNLGATGFELDVDRLDDGTLGGVQMRLAYSEPPIVGEARAVQFDIIQGGLNEDAHLFEMGVSYKPTALTTEPI